MIMNADGRVKRMGFSFRVKLAILIILCCFFNSYAQVINVNIHAHRGGMLEYEENTINALKETYERGIRGYEIDIRQTKDGKLVLLHDASLLRSVGIDRPIEYLTLNEIRKLRTKQGNTIPTLEEVLDFFNDEEEVYVEFEMKTNNPMYDEATLKRYCDQLCDKIYAAKPPTSTYVLTSFDKRPLKYLKENRPKTELMLIKSEGLSENLLQEANELGIKRVACRIDGTTRGMVQHAKEEGFTVCLWPGTSVEDFLLGVALGGDHLCTDVPLAISKWVKANVSWIKLK
jgi:glycerophosphoryl diester phosphodiesterase